MDPEISEICRVCLQTGASWNMFHKRNISNGNGKSPGVALDRLLEKFRYVTLLKMNEQENLPRVICDLCIVQLNVSYNFKRQAVDADSKFRQYIIEKGLSLTSTEYNLVAPSHIRHPSTTSSTIISRDSPHEFAMTSGAATVTTTSQLSYNRNKLPTNRIFRPMPIQIKIEPTTTTTTEECEMLSNITISPVQSEQASDVLLVNVNGLDTRMPPVLEEEEPLLDSSAHFNSDTSGSLIQLDDQISMVCLNGGENTVSSNQNGSNVATVLETGFTNSDKDIEFITNYVSTEAVLQIGEIVVPKEQAFGGIIVAARKRDKDEQHQPILLDDYQKKPNKTALKIKEEEVERKSTDKETSNKRYPARTVASDETAAGKKSTGENNKSRKSFTEMEIEIFTNRLRRLDREKQAVSKVKGISRNNHLKSRLNQLKEINRKQTDKTTKNVQSVKSLKNLKKKKDTPTEGTIAALIASVKLSERDAIKTRKYKNPFSKDAATKEAGKKKAAVKDEKKSNPGRSSQKAKTISKTTYNLSAIIANRKKNKLKQKGEKGSSSKSEK